MTIRKLEKLLTKKAALLQQCDEIDRKFRIEARNCDHYDLFKDQCAHPAKYYEFCDPMCCPFRGNMFDRKV